MASKTNNFGGFDEGDMFAPMDVSFDDPISENRGPAKPIREGVKQAAKDYLTDERTLRRAVRKGLPSQFEEIADAGFAVRDTVDQAIEDVKAGTRKPINKLAKMLGARVPKSMERTHKAIAWIKGQTDEYEFSSDSQAKIDANETTAALTGLDAKMAEILTAQAQQTQEISEENRQRDDIRRAEDTIQFTAQNRILQQIKEATTLSARFDSEVGLEFQKKSLETNYRIAFGIRDLNTKLNELTEATKAHLKAIQHNTGLPDEQKINLVERGTRNLKNKFVDRTLGAFGLGDGKQSRDFLGGFLPRVGANLKSMSRDVGEAINTATFLADTVMQKDDDFSGMSPEDQQRKKFTNMLASLGLEFVGDSVIGKGANALRKNNPKLEAFLQRAGNKGSYAVGNAQSLAKNYAYGGNADEGLFKGFLRQMVAGGLMGTDTDGKLDVSHGRSLSAAQHSDAQMRRAQIEVVPTLLSMILRETQMARTGQDPGLVRYDYKSGSFKSVKDAKLEILNRLKRNSFSKSNLDQVTEEVTQGMDDKDKMQLQKHLVKKFRSNAAVTDRSLMSSNFFNYEEDEEKRKDLAGRFAKHFDSADGKFSGTGLAEEKRRKFFANMRNAVSYMSDNRASIQDMVNEGDLGLLREMGLVDADNNIVDDVLFNWDLMDDPTIGGGTVNGPTIKARRAARHAIAGIPNNSSKTNFTFDPLKMHQTGAYNQGNYNTSDATGKPAEDNACKCVDQFDVLGALIQRAADTQTTYLSEIARNTEKLGYYFVQDAAINESKSDPSASGGKGFWQKTLGEHMVGLGNRARNAVGAVGSAVRGVGEYAGRYAMGNTKTTAWLRSTGALGAKKLQEFKDGLPTIADIYVKGHAYASITKKMFENQQVFDANGKVIRSLKELAEAGTDIYNEKQEMIISRADLVNTYLRGDGFMFVEKWTSFLLSKLKGGLRSLYETGLQAFGAVNTARKKLGNAARSATGFALELIAPTKDVYVRGETEPRLYANLIRRGWYTLQKTGKTVYSETQITGPLLDPEGNVALSFEDITKGLVDVEGNPIKSLKDMAVDFVRDRAKKVFTNLRNNFNAAKSLAKKTVVGGLNLVKNTASRINRLLRFGISGFTDSSGAVEAASQDAGVAGGMQVSLLTQIRDILMQTIGKNLEGTLGEGGIGSGLDRMKTAATGGMGRIRKAAQDLRDKQAALLKKDDENQGPTADTSQRAGTNKSHSVQGEMNSANSLLGLGSGLFNGAMGAVRGIRNRYRRYRGKEEIGPIDESTSGNMLKFKEVLSKMFGKGTDSLTRAKNQIIGEKDGSPEKKEGSWQSLRNKLTRSYENKQDEREMNFKDYGTQNSIDMMVDFVKDKAAGVGDLAGDAMDWYNDYGGDEGERRRRKRTRGGRGKKGRLPNKTGTGKTAAKKEITKRAQQAAAKRAAGAATAEATKAAATKAATTTVAKEATKFGAKRLAMSGLGAIFGVLASPAIGTAITVAGALWTAKSIYDWFMGNPVQADKPKGGRSDQILSSIRAIEYGGNLNDPLLMTRLLEFERMMYAGIKGKGADITVDLSKIDAQAALNIFGISSDNAPRVKSFTTWLSERFKPTFIKWCGFAEVVNKKLHELDKIEIEQKIKLLTETKRNNTGWNTAENPFSTTPTHALATYVELQIENAINLLSKQKKQIPEGREHLPEHNKGKIGELIRGQEQKLNDGVGEQFKNATDAALASKAAVSLGAAGKTDVKSASYSRAFTGTIPPLLSIRLRAYGFQEVNAVTYESVMRFERHMHTLVKFSSNGEASFSFDSKQAVQIAGECFGFNSFDEHAFKRCELWINERFTPVFAQYASCMYVQSGANNNLFQAENNLTPSQALMVARAILSQASVWNVTALPNSDYPALGFSSTTDIFVQLLEDQARKERLGEQTKRVSLPPTSQSSNNPSGGDPKPKLPEFKPSTGAPKTYVTPDGEPEPKGAGMGNTQKLSDAPKRLGLTVADGELFSGNGAEKYLRLKKGARVEGLNPAVKKMLFGMIEEYGSLTGKSTLINDGFRTNEDQEELRRKYPNKAAPAGSSLHERGLAVDINTETLDSMERLGLLAKYGFTRPVGGETWHIEPVGIQGSISAARSDPGAFEKAIYAGAGKGGGGVGATAKGFGFGRRDPNVLKTLESTNHQPVKKQDGKSIYASLPIPKNREDAKALISAAATHTGVDAKKATIKAQMESSLRPNQKANGTSATGLMQMTSGAWSDMLKQHGDKYGIPPDATPSDERANVLLGMEYMKFNEKQAANKGLESDLLTSYAMHMLGPTGGPRFLNLKDGDIPADHAPQQAAKNKDVFYNKDGSPRTKAQMVAYLNERLDSSAKSLGYDNASVNSQGAAVVQQARSSVDNRGTGASPQTRIAPSMMMPTHMERASRVSQQTPDVSKQVIEQFSKHLKEDNVVQTQQLSVLEEIAKTLVDIRDSVVSGSGSASGPKPSAVTQEQFKQPVAAVRRSVSQPLL